MCNDIDISSLPEEDQLYNYNKILDEAARLVRDKSFLDDPNSDLNIRLTVDSISRAVWRQNKWLAKTLIEESSLGATHITMSGAVIHYSDPEAFEELFKSVRSKQRQEEVAKLTSSISSLPADAHNARTKFKSQL